jgi:hypothetical protein
LLVHLDLLPWLETERIYQLHLATAILYSADCPAPVKPWIRGLSTLLDACVVSGYRVIWFDRESFVEATKGTINVPLRVLHDTEVVMRARVVTVCCDCSLK